MAASGVYSVSDGCTGFAWAEWIFPAARDCCAVHDYGGSNGALLDCLQGVLPHWAYVIAAFFVALMILFRPIYQAIKRWVERRSYRARDVLDVENLPVDSEYNRKGGLDGNPKP